VGCGDRERDPHLSRAYGFGQFRGVFSRRQAGPDWECVWDNADLEAVGGHRRFVGLLRFPKIYKAGNWKSTIAGHSTVHSGTWESHTVPKEASDESKRLRREYGGMAVGLGHIRGVDGVMPIESRETGTLEGPSSKM